MDPLGFWGWFYVIAVGLTVGHSLFPLNPKSAPQHVDGARIIAGSLIGTHVLRYIFNDPTPLQAYAMMDVILTGLFLDLAIRNRALWAAVCTLIHTAMGLLHLAYFLTGETNDTGYAWILNSLFLLALIVINAAIFAGRYAGSTQLDRGPVYRARGWTFAGVLGASIEADRRVAAQAKGGAR